MTLRWVEVTPNGEVWHDLSPAEETALLASKQPPVLTVPANPAVNTPMTITATLPAGSTDASVVMQVTAPQAGQRYNALVANLSASQSFAFTVAGTYTVTVTRPSGAQAQVQVVVW